MGGVGGGWICVCTVGHGEEERRRSSISSFVFWVLCASATAPQRLFISRSSELNSGQVGKKQRKKPPEEPHELGYRATSSASATHLPNKQTNKQILPLPFPSLHHGQTSFCHFCFYLLFFEWEEAAAKKWRRMSAARLCATLASCLETEHADEEEARRDYGKAKSSPQENFNVPTNRTI